jgi:Family of unknown function (DUF6931)
MEESKKGETPTSPVLSTGETLLAVWDAAGLSDGARALMKDADPRRFAEALCDHEPWAEAVAFFAHALPRREAVWWAFVCARAAAGPEPFEPLAASLEATRAWVREPSDENRRAAFQAGEAAGFDTPVGLAALAVFLAGDTLGPVDAPPAPPDPHAGAKAVAGAVSLAAVDRNPDDPAAAASEFLRQALQVAERARLWTPPTNEATGRRRRD